MRGLLPAAIAALLLAGAAQLEGQEHGTAKPEPIKVVPPAPTVTTATTATTTEAPPRKVNVTPTVPPAKVAAAVAEAIRQAEEKAAKRAARTTTRPLQSRRVAGAAQTFRRYELRWPEERMVVHWPGTEPVDLRVTLSWPDGF